MKGGRQGGRGWRSSPLCWLAQSFALALLAALFLPNLAQATTGNLDRSFGHHGWVRTLILGHDRAEAVAIDSKRRIVAAGYAASLGTFAVARYRPSGRRDHSFSGDGRVTTGFPGGPGYVTNAANAVAIDSRGRIVAAGSKCSWTAPPAEGGEVIDCESALARYDADGSLDASFGNGGRVTSDVASGAAVAIDSKDRVIGVGGDTIARYRQNGTLDPSFGDGGVATEDVVLPGYLSAVAIDSQGRIVTLGETFGPGLLVARFLPSGASDPSFGSGRGWAVARGGIPMAVAIDSKDRILAAGRTLPGHSTPGEFFLALCRVDGTLANRFGEDGRVTTHFPGRASAVLRSVAIDSRDRIVAVGGLGDHDYALARYRPNGSLDRSFSKNGKASGRFAAFNHRHNPGLVLGGAIDPRDRIVVAGGESHFLLTRFIGYPGQR